MHSPSQFDLEVPQNGPHAIASCMALELEAPPPRRAADEREPQEVEGLRPSQLASPASSRGEAAELQQTSLLLVEREAELFEPRLHCVPEVPRIGLALEAGHHIIGKAHEDHLVESVSCFGTLTLMKADLLPDAH